MNSIIPNQFGVAKPTLESGSGLRFFPKRQKQSDTLEYEDIPQTEIEDLSDTGMGFLEAAGNVLDTPRAMAWHLFTGRNPFAVANPFNREAVAQRITGWDVLDALGIHGKPGFDPTDILAGALEIVGDPTLGLSGPFSSVTKAGKLKMLAKPTAMKEATEALQGAIKGTVKHSLGRTPAAMAQEIRAGERALAGWRIPFTNIGFTTNLGLPKKVAATLWEKLHYGRFSPVPYVREAFSNIVGGVSGSRLPSAPFQMQHDLAYTKMRDIMGAYMDMQALAQKELDEINTLWKDVAEYAYTQGGHKINTLDEFIRYAAETPTAKALPEHRAGERLPSLTHDEIRDLFVNAPDVVSDKITEVSQRVYQFADTMKSSANVLYDTVEEMGGKWGLLDTLHGTSHLPRHSTIVSRASEAIGATRGAIREMAAAMPETKARAAILSFPGDTALLQRISQDPLLVATERMPVVSLNQAGDAADKMGLSVGSVVKTKTKDGKEIVARVLSVDDDTVTIVGRGFNMADEVVDTVPVSKVTKLTPQQTAHVSDLVPRVAHTSQSSVAKALGGSLDTLEELQAQRVWSILEPEMRARFEKTFGVPVTTWDEARRALNVIARNSATESQARAAQKWIELINAWAGPKAENIVALTRYLRTLPFAAQEVGLFGGGVLRDMAQYMKHAAASVGNLLAAHNLIQQVAKVGTEGKGMMSLTDAIREASVPVPRVRNGKITYINDRALNDKGLWYAVRRFVRDNVNKESLQRALGPDVDRHIANVLKEVPDKESIESAAYIGRHILVDDRLPDTLARYVGFSGPDTRMWLGKLYDWTHSLWRRGLTKYWLNFHVRNRIDGFWRNLVAAGAATYSVHHLMKHELEVMRAMASLKPDEDVLNKLSHGNAWKELNQSPIGATPLAEIGGVERRTPVVTLKSLLFGGKEDAAKAVLEGRGPWKGLERLTDRMYSLVEFANRYPVFAAAIDSGKTPWQAMELANEIQFKYGKEWGGAVPTALGRTTMKRAVTFWSFASQNLPYQLRQIMDRPGGPTAQTLRIINLARGGGGQNASYIPEWMREQTAIRIGGDDEAAQFVRQLGLSLEQMNIPVFTRYGSIYHPFNTRTAQRILSNLSPILQIPIRIGTERDLYSGRKLKDLPPITGNRTLDAILTSSPASRAARTAAVVLDQSKPPSEKALELITGTKLSTLNLPVQRLYDQAAAVRRRLEEKPEVVVHEVPFVPKSREHMASDETRRLLSVLNAIERKRLALNRRK